MERWIGTFEMIWIAAWLSWYMIIGRCTSNLNFSRRCLIHISTHEVWTMSLYSASALEWKTTLWFLLFQVIELPLRTEHYHVLDLLSEGNPAQSKSVKGSTGKWPLVQYKIQHSGWALRYLINPENSFPMWTLRSSHILTHNTDCRWYIWPGNSKVVQLYN